MRMPNRVNRRLFYVVQFIELPFEGIDDYVCVPYSWTIPRKPSVLKIVVTYPNNEDPIDTRDRVKREERPNDKWRFYTALVKYKSDDYSNAENWIARRNDYGPGEDKSEIRDPQPEPALRKLRSASQPTGSDPNSDKPQLTEKANKNPRKPLPRMSIRRPLSQSPVKNQDNKRLKLNANAKPGIDTNQAIIASGFSKQERSIIITDNQLIQNDQTKTSFASNGKMNTERSSHPGVIENNQSVDLSVQSSSKTLLAQQQPSLVALDYQQSLSMPVIDLAESNEDIESSQNVLSEPVAEERPSTKTPPNTRKQTSQAEPINERSTVLVRHKHSLPEPRPRDLSVRQTKEPDVSQKTYLNRNLTASKIEPRPPSTANQSIQQYVHPQLTILPVSSTLYSKPKPQGMDESNSIEAVHNHQKPRSQDFMFGNKPSTSRHEPNCQKLSQMLTNSAKKQIPVGKNLKNPVDKKTRLEGITKNITTMQYPTNSTMQFSSPTGSAVRQTAPLPQNYLQQTPVNSSLVNNVRGSMGEECKDQRDPIYEGIMNTSAAQNLLKLAHPYSSFVEASREHQYLSTQEDYLQQFARMQDMLRTQIMAQTIDQRVHHQNTVMNGGFTIQSQPNLINQPIQFLPRNYNQYIPVNSAYAQEVIRNELKRSIDGAYTTYKPIVQNVVNIETTAHNSSNQPHHNFKHPQLKRYPPNYEDPCITSTQNSQSLKSKRSSHILGPQKVTKRPRSLSTSNTPGEALSDAQKSYLFQEPDLQSTVNQSYTEYNNSDLVDVRENFTVEPVPTTQDSKVQNMRSSDRQHETQSKLAQSNYARQPRTKKTTVDQATETDAIIDVNHCVDEIARTPVGEIPPKVVDSACQTDEQLREEQGSLYQETVSDFTRETESAIESENGVMSEANQTTQTTAQNRTPDNQLIQARKDAEQDMLETCGTLFTQMGANLSYIRDMFHNLRGSILVCAETYEKLLDKVDKFNSIESDQSSTSPPNNMPSQVPQVTQEIPEVDDDNNTSVGDAPTLISEQRGTFSLPPEYDPNDTRWTLKYREFKEGLVELIPRTGVYVSKKERKRCIQESSDCRTLARLLLTEVFSTNALSVCSWTGEKPKAFNSVNIPVRPGLDKHAGMVMLTFVEEYGNKHGWNTYDTSAVMSTIRTKIYDIRAKHGKPLKA